MNNCHKCEGFYNSSICPGRCGGDDNNTIIVTRHPALVKYLKKQGIRGDVISHATPDNVKGKDVIGVLPHSLSCLTKTFSEIPLTLPAELRGKELTLAQVKKYAGEMVTYTINKKED